MSSKPTFYTKVGNIGNILFLSLTILVSICMFYQLPNKEIFDSNWLKNGFCVSNEETLWLNSHILSFYANTALSAMIAYLCFVQPKDVPLLQKEILKGAIVGVLGHGLGHLYIGAVNPNGVDIRFQQSEDLMPTAINFFSLIAIFKGSMPFASMQKLAFHALIVIIGFTIFDIEPKLTFIYAQAAIIISITTHALSLPTEHKNTATFMLIPFLNFPVLVVGIMESTACESFLASLGGHAVYDSVIAFAFIMVELFSNHLQVPKVKSV